MRDRRIGDELTTDPTLLAAEIDTVAAQAQIVAISRLPTTEDKFAAIRNTPRNAEGAYVRRKAYDNLDENERRQFDARFGTDLNALETTDEQGEREREAQRDEQRRQATVLKAQQDLFSKLPKARQFEFLKSLDDPDEAWAYFPLMKTEDLLDYVDEVAGLRPPSSFDPEEDNASLRDLNARLRYIFGPPPPNARAGQDWTRPVSDFRRDLGRQTGAPEEPDAIAAQLEDKGRRDRSAAKAEEADKIAAEISNPGRPLATALAETLIPGLEFVVGDSAKDAVVPPLPADYAELVRVLEARGFTVQRSGNKVTVERKVDELEIDLDESPF